MCKPRIKQCQIFICGDQCRLGNDQVADAAIIHYADRFACRVIHSFGRLETIGHTAQPQDGSGRYAFQTAGNFTDVGHSRIMWISQVAEVEQRLCIAVCAIMDTTAAIQIKPCIVFAFATLVSGDRLQEGFKFSRHKALFFSC